MRIRLSPPLWLPFLLALLAPVEVLGEARFEGLGILRSPDVQTWANGVSGDGSVVIGSSFRRTSRAVRWTERGGKFRVAILSGRTSNAYAASTDGRVIVGDVARRVHLFGPSFPFEQKYDAVRWIRARGDRMPRERDGSFATDVSSNGSVACGVVDDGAEKAVLWIGAGEPLTLGDLPGGDGTSRASGISASGRVVVGSARAYDRQAFRWTAESGMVGLGTLPDLDSSEATEVSADGTTIVGISGTPNEDYEAFRWTDAEGMVGLGDLPGGLLGSRATAVSGDGSRVIGMGSTPYRQLEPFLWDASRGMRPLAEVLVSEHGLDLTDWQLETVSGISDDGTVIVGTGIVFENLRYYRQAWRAVIPVP